MIKNKLQFKEGEHVSFNIGNGIEGLGVIRGKASEGLVDIWIVEIITLNIDRSEYPWTCCTIPHTLLSKWEPKSVGVVFKDDINNTV